MHSNLQKLFFHLSFIGADSNLDTGIAPPGGPGILFVSVLVSQTQQLLVSGMLRHKMNCIQGQALGKKATATGIHA